VLQITACMKADVRARHGNNCRAARVGVEGMSDDLSWKDQPDRSRRLALRRVDAQETHRQAGTPVVGTRYIADVLTPAHRVSPAGITPILATLRLEGSA
jgi:hypothetical protein